VDTRPPEDVFVVGLAKRVVSRNADEASDPENRGPLFVRRLEDDEIERVGAVLGLARLHQSTGFHLVAWEGAELVGHA
jgi:hypothetical protein